MRAAIVKIISVIMALCILVTCGCMLASAASNAITVRSAITGELLYSGNDLQEALDAAERGSIVSVGKYITLTEGVVVDVEIMFSGFNYVRGLSRDVQIKLTGDGAIYIDTRIKSTCIAALYSYSTVEVTEENDGYIYYLVTQAPSLEGKMPVISQGEALYGARIDEEAGVIYLDAIADGISTDALSTLITMDADNAEGVDVTFKNVVDVDNKKCVTNGTMITMTAANYDYPTKTSKSYRIIVLGDVNGNGRLDAADASVILQSVNGTLELSGDALIAADTDLDGLVTEADAFRICKKYVSGYTYKTVL